jgi:threonine aldolase
VEVAALSAAAHDLKMHVHMDGARFANACANLDCTAAEITWKVGVDVLCFGGTKNGMAIGEAVVFFNKPLAVDFRCKQAGQLASKMRFLAAPWIGMFETGAWLRKAVHANACAQHLLQRIQNKKGIEILFPVEANAVFLQTTPTVLDALRARGWLFYTFIGSGARFMFSWDSTLDRVDRLAEDILSLAESSAAHTI